MTHRSLRPRRGAAVRAALCGAGLSLVAGCAAPAPWGEVTRGANRYFCVDDRNDRRLVYRDFGRSEAETTLLFVHGVGSSKATWMFVAPQFQNDYRIVLVDLLGHGDADKPRPYDYSMSSQGRTLGQFIERQDLRGLVIVGCSYGASAALEALHADAELRARVRGLVLIGPPTAPFAPPAGLDAAASPALRGLLVMLSAPESRARLVLEGAFHRDERIPPELLAELARTYRDPAALEAGLDAGLEIFRELAARQLDAGRYAAVRCPVLLLRGAQDNVVPADVVAALAQVLTGATTQAIADCGHTPEEEQPYETVVAIRWFLRAHGW